MCKQHEPPTMTYPEYVALLKKKLDTGRYLLFLSGIINLILLEELVRRGMEAAS